MAKGKGWQRPWPWWPWLREAVRIPWGSASLQTDQLTAETGSPHHGSVRSVRSGNRCAATTSVWSGLRCWASDACALIFCKISMIQHCDCYRCCSQTCQSFFAPIVLTTSFSSPWSSVDLPCLLDYFCQLLPRLFLVTLQSLRFFPFCLTSQAWAQSQRRGYITPKAIPQGAMAGSKRLWQTIFAL